MKTADTTNSDLNLPRIIFIILLLLSLFTIEKSSVATYNVEQWSDEVRLMFMEEQRIARRSNHLEAYIVKLEAIQKQWSIMRIVSIALAVLSCLGIFLVSGSRGNVYSTRLSFLTKLLPNRFPETTEILPDKKLDKRLNFAAMCNAFLFILILIPFHLTPKLFLYGATTTKLFWEEAKTGTLTFIGSLLPCIALVSLLPVFIRGTKNQTIIAATIAVPTAYFTYHSSFFLRGFCSWLLNLSGS
ncbi:MAG: hypothetical protein ACR2H1_02940 [Limisphaerales bacterium]